MSARTMTGADSKFVWLAATRVHRQVGGAIVAADHDRIDGRQLVPRHVGRVGRVAVGEQQHAGQRQAAEAARERIERRLQRAALCRRTEARRNRRPREGAQSNANRRASKSSPRRCCQPASAAQQLLQLLAARVGCAAVVDRHALAVVGDDGEHVGAAAGARAAQQRLDQAQREAGEADRFERRGRKLHAIWSTRSPVAPHEREAARRRQRERGPAPGRRSPDERRQAHSPLPSRS